MARSIHWHDLALLKKKFVALELEAIDVLPRAPGSFGADQMMMRVTLLDLKQTIDELVEQTQNQTPKVNPT